MYLNDFDLFSLINV